MSRPETCPTCGSNKRHVFIGPPCILSPDDTYDPWHDSEPDGWVHDGTCCTNAAGMPNCFDPAPTPAPREDICKGCSTYAWCSVTGACLAESNPHDKGDRDRVVSTLSMLDPSPPSSPPTVAVPRDVYEAMRDEMDGLFDLFVDVLAQGTARADSDHKTGACVITYDDGCISSYEDAFAYLGLTETPEKRWFTSDEFYAAVKAKRAALRGGEG